MEAFRKELAGRIKGEAWHVLALRLDEAVVGATSLGYGEDVVKRMAEEATGLSWGLVTRYLSTIRRVKIAAAAAGVATETLLSPGFNSVEIAVRLYDRSPAQGLEALKSLTEGRIMSAQLKRKLAESFALEESAFDPRSRTLRRRGLELQTVETALKRGVGTVFPKDSFVQRRPYLRFFRRIGMEVRGPDGACVCGLDLMTSHADDASGELEDAFPSAYMLSLYFPAFYFVFSPNSPQRAVDEAISALELFECPWFGVMKVLPDHSIEQVRPVKGRPKPDRSDEYESFRTKLAVGRRSGGAPAGRPDRKS